MSPIAHDGAARPGRRRAYTLLEAMFSVTILFAVIAGVTGAISAGHQHAEEAHLRIAGTLAAQDMVGRVIVTDYDQLPTWHGYHEAVGAMLDMRGAAMPEAFDAVGREVDVTTEMRSVGGCFVRGREVRVRAFNESGRVLVELVSFVPEPQGDTRTRTQSGDTLGTVNPGDKSGR